MIALDGRTTRQMSVGMQRYARALTERLPKVAPDLRFAIFTEGENFTLAEQVMMPLAMWRKHPRLIHHLSLYAPLLRVAPTIVTIHDLIHLRYPNIFHRRSGPIIGGLYAPYYSALNASSPMMHVR